MSKTTVEVIKCDKCDKKQVDTRGWDELAYDDIDLCGDCLAAFKLWLSGLEPHVTSTEPLTWNLDHKYIPVHALQQGMKLVNLGVCYNSYQTNNDWLVQYTDHRGERKAIQTTLSAHMAVKHS